MMSRSMLNIMLRVPLTYTDMKKYLIPILLSLFSVPLSYISTSIMMLSPFAINYYVTVALFTLSFNVTAFILTVSRKKNNC